MFLFLFLLLCEGVFSWKDRTPSWVLGPFGPPHPENVIRYPYPIPRLSDAEKMMGYNFQPLFQFLPPFTKYERTPVDVSAKSLFPEPVQTDLPVLPPTPPLTSSPDPQHLSAAPTKEKLEREDIYTPFFNSIDVLPHMSKTIPVPSDLGQLFVRDSTKKLNKNQTSIIPVTKDEHLPIAMDVEPTKYDGVDDKLNAAMEILKKDAQITSPGNDLSLLEISSKKMNKKNYLSTYKIFDKKGNNPYRNGQNNNNNNKKKNNNNNNIRFPNNPFTQIKFKTTKQQQLHAELEKKNNPKKDKKSFRERRSFRKLWFT